jgi:nitroimidazol reductase NimA-like FMN-containing flavoprotein (pyridoxamine 5'-phosphate oxidase superfamily)
MDRLTTEESLALLAERPVAHVGVIAPEGPYVTPISYVLTGSDPVRLVFRTAPGKRSDAIEMDNRVSVEASRYDDDTGSWASVIVRGRARIVRNDPALEVEVVSALVDKYRSAYDTLLAPPPHADSRTIFLVVVDVLEVSGRRAGTPLGPRTRPGRL